MSNSSISTTLSKEHIAAIQARAEESIKAIAPHIPALCQQALRAIELEAAKKDQHDRFIRQVMDVEKDICKFLNREWHPSGMSLVSLVADLQTELTAARNALEEERERSDSLANQIVDYREGKLP